MQIGVVVLVVVSLLTLLFIIPKKASAAVTTPGKYPYADLINKWALRFGVDPDLVAAHAKVESNFNPDAVNYENPALDYDSSYGLLQVQLAVAQDFGYVKDYRNPAPPEIAWLMIAENNIEVGTRNIARWMNKYPFEVAVQIYNVGEAGYVKLGRRNADYLRKIQEAYNGYKAS